MCPQLSYCTKNNHKIMHMKYSKHKNNTQNNIVVENIFILHINIDLDPDLDNNEEKDIKYNENIHIEENVILKDNLIIDDIIKDEEIQNNFLDYETQSQNSDSNDKEEKLDNKKQIKITNNNKIKIDKRFKFPEDLKEQFFIEKFLSEDDMRKEFEKKKFSVNYMESRFKCDSCFKGFRENKLLEMHLIKHNVSSGNYVCKICSIRSATSKQYRTHRDGNHTAKFSCKSCDFITFSKAQARNHLSWHLGVEHKCPHCSMSFRKYTTLMGHIRIIHPSQYICGHCANSFVSEHGLNHHIKLVHKNSSQIIKNSDEATCKECNVIFVTNKIYIKHLLISPKHKEEALKITACRECGEQFMDKESLSKHSHRNKHNYRQDKPSYNKQRNFTCTQCDKSFQHPTSVYQHFIKNHPNIPYKMSRNRNICLCEQCGKTFMCQSKLLAHKMLHSGEKPYSCRECGKTFRTGAFLTKHLVLHRGVKQHQCKVCGKQFANAGNLFKHNRIHSGEKPFKCSLCSKAFVDSSNLKQHIQGVHYNVKRNRKR